MLPVLLHRIKNTTQLLVGVDTLFDATDGERFGADLASASNDVDDLGWWLGVLAAGLGADTLVSRVEKRGLDSLVLWARGALRRSGRDLELPRVPLPAIRLDAQRAQRLAWAFVSLLVQAGKSRGEGERLEWRLTDEGERWRVEFDAPIGPEALSLARELPECAIAGSANSFAWSFPLAWLEHSAA